MLGLWDIPRKTEDKVFLLSRLHMRLPSKCTDTIFTFWAASSFASMDTGTKNSLIFFLIPKNPLFLSNFLLDSCYEQDNVVAFNGRY